MTKTIKTAMILAAGLGSRMRPLTNSRPKPMVEVGGKTLIDWVLDDLAVAGIEHAVINLHYKAEMLRDHLSSRVNPVITLSDESEGLLDTGGGVAAALPLIEDDVFLVTNSDALWQGGFSAALERLRTAWLIENRDNRTDALLLLADMKRAFGFDGDGDFFLSEDSSPVRRGDKHSAPMAYSGTQLVHRRLFEDCPNGSFSFNTLWDAAHQQGYLKAVLHKDDWYHIGTPEAVALTGRALTLGGRSLA